MTIKEKYVAWRLEHQLHFNRKIRESVLALYKVGNLGLLSNPHGCRYSCMQFENGLRPPSI